MDTESSAAIKLILAGDQEELQLIEGWCAVGHLEELLRKRQVITGGQASATDLIRVGLYAKDKTLGTSMFHILNWRGGWWLKENPDWGRVVPGEEVPSETPPLPGPMEAPPVAEGRPGRRWRSRMPQVRRTIGSEEAGSNGGGRLRPGKTRGASGSTGANEAGALPKNWGACR